MSETNLTENKLNVTSQFTFDQNSILSTYKTSNVTFTNQIEKIAVSSQRNSILSSFYKQE